MLFALLAIICLRQIFVPEVQECASNTLWSIWGLFQLLFAFLGPKTFKIVKSTSWCFVHFWPVHFWTSSPPPGQIGLMLPPDIVNQFHQFSRPQIHWKHGFNKTRFHDDQSILSRRMLEEQASLINIDCVDPLGAFIYTGCFFSHWYPPKKLKYGKPRLGESTST